MDHTHVDDKNAKSHWMPIYHMTDDNDSHQKSSRRPQSSAQNKLIGNLKSATKVQIQN